MVETRAQARRRHRDETEDDDGDGGGSGNVKWDKRDATEVHAEGECNHDHSDSDNDCCSDHGNNCGDSDDESDTGRVPSAKRVHLNPVPRHRALVHVAARVLVLSCALATVYLTARVAYRAWIV
jgi:hypothetical protein